LIAKSDGLARIPKATHPVIPAKAGIQGYQRILNPGDPVLAKAGSRGDGVKAFLRTHQVFLIRE
jgi:hypothetical protein